MLGSYKDVSLAFSITASFHETYGSSEILETDDAGSKLNFTRITAYEIPWDFNGVVNLPGTCPVWRNVVVTLLGDLY